MVGKKLSSLSRYPDHQHTNPARHSRVACQLSKPGRDNHQRGDVCLRDANLIEAWAVKAKHEASVASNSFLTSHRRFYLFKDPMSQSRVTRKATTATKIHTRTSKTNGKGSDQLSRCLTQAKWVYFGKRCKQNIHSQGGETQVWL